LTLVEPVLAGRERRTSGFRDIIGIVNKILFEKSDLRFNLLSSSMIGATTLLMAWFAQPLFEKMLLPLALFGTVWTVLNLITGGSSILAHRIEKKLGESGTLKVMAVLIPALMMVSGIVPDFAILPLLACFYFLRGIATPVLKDYINKHTGSEMRATVMSLRDLTIRIFFALLAPMAGWTTDHYSLGAGLALSGAVILSLSLLALGLFLRFRNSG